MPPKKKPGRKPSEWTPEFENLADDLWRRAAEIAERSEEALLWRQAARHLLDAGKLLNDVQTGPGADLRSEASARSRGQLAVRLRDTLKRQAFEIATELCKWDDADRIPLPGIEENSRGEVEPERIYTMLVKERIPGGEAQMEALARHLPTTTKPLLRPRALRSRQSSAQQLNAKLDPQRDLACTNDESLGDVGAQLAPLLGESATDRENAATIEAHRQRSPETIDSERAQIARNWAILKSLGLSD